MAIQMPRYKTLNFTQGQATDIIIQAEEISKLKKQLNLIYSKHCDKPLDFIGEQIK